MKNNQRGAECFIFMRRSVLLMAVLAGVLAFCGSAFAVSGLKSGETYTINFATIGSNGQVNPAAYSTTGIANSSGIVNFSLSGVPDNSSCNFMDVTVAAPAGAPDYVAAANGVVRESVVPCPTKDSNMPLGISGVTNAQAAALKTAFSAAGTDDPILAVFFFTAVQTTDIPSQDLKNIAKYAGQGIEYGFVNSLTTNHSVNATTLGEYRKNIVQDLADPNSGYTKFLKEAASTISNSTSEKDMGKASSLILSTLVQATKSPTDTGIHAGWIIEGTDAMGNYVVPYLMDPNIWASSSTPVEIQDSVGTGLQKLGEQVAIQKYENAMTLLGATGGDVTQFQNAATALQNAVDSAMENFNEAAFANGVAASPAVMNAASQEMQNTTMNDFNQFQSDIQASNQRIGIINSNGTWQYDGTDPSNMISNICTALGSSAPTDDPTSQIQPNTTACTTVLAHMDAQWGMFKWFTPSGQVNWPINMVILADWTSNLLKNGGSMSYNRDTTDFNALKTKYPNDQMLTGWAGYCDTSAITNSSACTSAGGNWMSGYCNGGPSNNTDTGCQSSGVWVASSCSIYNSQQCTPANNATWVPALSCFGQPGSQPNGQTEPLTSEGEEPSQYCQQNPYPYWIMFAIQQDIQVVQDIQMNAQQAAGGNMGNQGTAQQNLDKALSNIAKAITGTTNGSTAISSAQQKAIMELMSPPQM